MPLRPPTATIRTQVALPLRFADGYADDARVFSFDGLVDGREHLAFGLGDRAAARPAGGRRAVPLIRPHSECLTGDVFGSQRCDCGPQLREAVERIADAGGYLLYLRQEGRGIGLYAEARRVRAAGHRGSTPTRRTSRWATARTSAATWPPRRCCTRSGVAGRPAQQQPGQGPAAPPLRRDRRRAGADRRAPVRRERPLPGDEGAPGRAHARPPAARRRRSLRARAGSRVTSRTRRGSGRGRRSSARPAPSGRGACRPPSPSRRSGRSTAGSWAMTEIGTSWLGAVPGDDSSRAGGRRARRARGSSRP